MNLIPLALFVFFLVLKLRGQITWSWWWVTCPLWIGYALALVLFLLFLLRTVV